MVITDNRKAFHDYFIEERLEVGLVLEGWEVKSIRAGRVQIKESYVMHKNGAFWLIGAHISPLTTASTHVSPDPIRSRKILMHKREIEKWSGRVDRAGFTVMALNLHFQKGRIKLEIGLAKGKKLHDKRASEKEREWVREKAQMVRTNNKRAE